MDDVIKNFMTGASGNRPEDYYYKYTSNGTKYFYSKITGQRVARNTINSMFVDQIAEKNSSLDIGILIEQRNKYLSQVEKLRSNIEKLQLKIGEIDNQLSDLGVNDETTMKKYQKLKEDEDKKNQQRKAEYLREYEEIFRRKTNSNAPPPAPLTANQTNNTTLTKLGINTKKEWHEWLIKNHPDKGGSDLELCQKVLSEGKSRWC